MHSPSCCRSAWRRWWSTDRKAMRSAWSRWARFEHARELPRRRSIDSAPRPSYAANGCLLFIPGEHSMFKHATVAAALGTALVLVSVHAFAQDTKVAIGMSGWTGFAPLTLAKEAGIFKKNGLDVTLKMIPQKDRHLAIASGDIQCAATTVETWVVWNANGVATTQIFQLDKSFGADGMVVRNSINKIADLKGKTVAASAPGTAPYFTLAWILKKNGLSVKDVKVVNLEPQAAANAFLAGTTDIDAGMTYEPYLSGVRAKPEAGKIIATTLDYPMVMDTFGCTPKLLADNPKAPKALADAYFDAVDMITPEPKKTVESMDSDVKQA